MSLRVSLLRSSRLLETCKRPLVRPFLVQDWPARRSFYAYPPLRQSAGNSTSSENSSSERRNSESSTSASTESAPSSGTASEAPAEPVVDQSRPAEASSQAPDDNPPHPPKRDVDPKDHKLAEWKDKYLRSVAEFRNLQTKTRRDVAAAQAFTIQRFAMDLLDTIDTLTTSLESCPPLPPLQTSDPNQKEDILITEHRNLHEGLGMVENILMRALERNGLTAIPTEGEPMPGFHEIVREVEGEENDVGMIANVLKRGYSLNGKVLRPAKVVLFRARSSTEETPVQQTPPDKPRADEKSEA